MSSKLLERVDDQIPLNLGEPHDRQQHYLQDTNSSDGEINGNSNVENLDCNINDGGVATSHSKIDSLLDTSNIEERNQLISQSSTSHQIKEDIGFRVSIGYDTKNYMLSLFSFSNLLAISVKLFECRGEQVNNY